MLGSIPLMTIFLEAAKVDPNLPDSEGNTALHLSVAQRSNREQTKFLLAKGANPNFANKEGNTPLFVVGSVEAAELLVHSGADLRVENNST